METISEQKIKLRIKLKKVLSLLSNEEKRSKSKIIIEKLLSNPIYISAKSLLIYSSTANEPYTLDLIGNWAKYNKIIYIPCVSELRVGMLNSSQKLIESKNGIIEPQKNVSIENLRSIDLVVLPGLGFDKHLNRIGHGSGWYDKALKIIDPKYSIGLCFKEQVVNHIPTETFDVKVDQLITD